MFEQETNGFEQETTCGQEVEQAPGGHIPLALWTFHSVEGGRPREGQNGAPSPICEGNISGRSIIS